MARSRSGRKPQKAPQTSSAPIAAYYLTLLLFLAGSFFPEARIWGINIGAFTPPVLTYSVLLILALFPWLLRLAPGATAAKSSSANADSQSRTFGLVVSGIIVGYAVMFFLLRAQTHFLGDGYLLLASLASDQPLVKGRDFGTMTCLIGLKSLLGGEGQAAALHAYQVLSILAGVLLLVATAVTSRLLYDDPMRRLFLILGVGSGGYMLLFFGYVENYALLALSIGLFCLMELLIGNRRFHRAWILLPLALAIFAHAVGLTLLPAALYLLILRRGKKLSGRARNIAIIAGLGVMAAGVWSFAHLYATNLYFRFARMPIVSPQTATRYSLAHTWRTI
jgi:hypothetical protein